MANVLIDGLKERISNAIKINQSIGILLPGTNYPDLIQAMFEHIKSKPNEAWVYVTVTKPYDTIAKQYEFIKEAKNIKFIDCISRAAGISTPHPNCMYIESPTMLEKVSMEAMNIFKDTKGDSHKFLVIDSLSAMMIYNDPETVQSGRGP